MTSFLLEIGSEEIPARMQAAAAAQLAKRFSEAGAASGLANGAVTADATPRRLWLVAEDVADGSAASSEERRGPRADAPDKALEGFLRSTGLSRDQLEARDTGKGVFLFAVIERAGRPAADILSETITQIITGFDWPKSMRWGSGSVRWVRPLTHIVALLDDAVVEASVHGFKTGRTSRGHRIHAPAPLEITNAGSYAQQLADAKVIIETAKRRAVIAERAAALAAEAGLSVIPDEGLEAENAGLTEWPVPLLGRFDPGFLAVPREVIQLTMRTNQKYFALADAEGALAPAFIAVANLDASDGGKAIAKGNERVLSARLSDAKFFWDQDLATVRKGGLEAFLPKLETIVFHEKLGTMADKVERIAKLARWLAESGVVPGADPDVAERAARLCKADLVSATVGEFPEVQGIAGGYLASEAGLALSEAAAIRDHYKPIGQGDDVPVAPTSIAIALADKLDTIVGFFALSELPSGSRDPYALRRAANGILGLIVNNNLRMNFLLAAQTALISVAASALKVAYREDIARTNDATLALLGLERNDLSDRKKLEMAIQETPLAAYVDGNAHYFVMDFVIDRLAFQRRSAGLNWSTINAVLRVDAGPDIVRLLARVDALSGFLETEDGESLLAGYKRAANILKAEDAKDGPHKAAALAPDALEDAAEITLHKALSQSLPAAAAAVEEEDFTAAMAALAALRGPVDRFFTDVMVNAPVATVRQNRLALLAAFRDAVHSVADFSRIEG